MTLTMTFILTSTEEKQISVVDCSKAIYSEYLLICSFISLLLNVASLWEEVVVTLMFTFQGLPQLLQYYDF